MTARAPPSTSVPSAYDPYRSYRSDDPDEAFDENYADTATHQTYAPGELVPEDRIGRPLARRRGKVLLRWGIVTLIVLGGGWALLDDTTKWRGLLAAMTTAVSPAFDRKTDQKIVAPAETAAPAMVLVAPPTIADLPAPRAVPDVAQSPGMQPQAPGELALAPQESEAAASQPAAPVGRLPPPTVDPDEPNQVRAAAVGLHPGLSRALLARLSPTDYRNAGIAIKTALAETPDAAVYVWPREPKPDLAVFQVHFVAGAAFDCRRYVVTVGKDGWSTTALPMEKCAPAPSKPGRPRRE